MEGRKSIIVNYSPFLLNQDVYCWIDGDCVEQRKCSVNEVPDTVLALKRKYQVRSIELVGPEAYLNEFKQTMKIENKFAEGFKDCTINIVNR